MSNKRETETPGVFEISMKNGQKRLWCGDCKKFLSNASNGFHTCDPNWRQRLEKGKTTGKSRRWRLTPARKNKLMKIIEQSVKYAAISGELNKIVKKNPKWRGLKKLASSAIDKKRQSVLHALKLL